MKLKTFLFAALLLLSASTINAQSYRTGIGARLGFFNGITAKHFVSPNNAVEGILNFRWGGANPYIVHPVLTIILVWVLT